MGTWNTLFPVDQPAINLSKPDNNPLTFEGSAAGYLSSANYNDTYPITLQKGFKYDFITVNDGSGSGSKGSGYSGVWTDILIYDSNGDLLKLNRSTSSETVGYNGDIFDFEVQNSGTYYVSESMYFTTDRGSYSLFINIDPPTASTTTTTTVNTPSTATTSNSVFRFRNSENGTHFFTASTAERDNLINNTATYNYEGIAFTSATASSTNSVGVYRFYHATNGAHFYTASTVERDNLIQNFSGSYSYEGEAFRALPANQSSSTSTPVYRFYNTSTDSHFFTVSSVERDNIITNLSASYRYEGIAYNVPTSSAQASPEAPALAPASAAPFPVALEASQPEPDDQGQTLQNVLPQFAQSAPRQDLTWEGFERGPRNSHFAVFAQSSPDADLVSLLMAG